MTRQKNIVSGALSDSDILAKLKASGVDTKIEELLMAKTGGLVDNAEASLTTNFNGNVTYLKQAATIFVAQITQYANLKAKMVSSTYSSLVNNKKYGNLYGWSNAANTRTEDMRTRLAYTAVFDFQAAIQRFLGQPSSRIIIVLDSFDTKSLKSPESMFSSAELKIFKDLNMAPSLSASQFAKRNAVTIASLDPLAALGYINNTGHFQETAVREKLLENNLTNGLQRKNEAIKTLSPKNELTEVYNFTLWKLSHSYFHTPSLLLWKSEDYSETNKKWLAGEVNNYGDVREAYMAALVMEHQKKMILRESNKESQVGIFFNEYIKNVTNLPAYYQEDVYDNNRGINYAVKSADAQLPKIITFLDLAYKILTFKDSDIKNIWSEGEIEKHNVQRNKNVDNISEWNQKRAKQIKSSEDIAALLKQYGGYDIKDLKILRRKNSKNKKDVLKKINNSLSKIQLMKIANEISQLGDNLVVNEGTKTIKKK